MASNAPVSQQLENLWNGISQQVPGLRLASQAEEQENCVASPADGLYKRPPFKRLGHLVSGQDKQVLSVDRDGIEQYHLALRDGGLDAYTLKGTAIPVLASPASALNYLKGTPRELRALTIEDATFVVNPNIRPTLEPLCDATGTYRVDVVVNDAIAQPWAGKLFLGAAGGMAEVTYSAGAALQAYVDWFRTQVTAAIGAAGLTITQRDAHTLRIEGPVRPGVFAFGTGSAPALVKVVQVPPTLPDVLYVVIKEGVPEQTYSVAVDGHLASYNTPTSDRSSEYRVNTIAASIAGQVNTWAGYAATVHDNIVRITKPGGGAAMTFAVSSTWGSNGGSAACYGMKRRVQAFEDLPERFPTGEVIEIVENGDARGYFVRYEEGKVIEQTVTVPNDGKSLQWSVGLNGISKGSNTSPGVTTRIISQTEEQGAWMECAGPLAPVALVPASLPHIILNAGNKVTIQPWVWEDRHCGDQRSAPAPSFVGARINDLFLYRNRLGLITDETVCLSKAGGFNDFWARTVKDVLDGDPIDVRVTSAGKPVVLRSVAVMDKQLLLMSSTAQYVVASQGVLSPKTIVVTPSTQQPCNASCRPASVGHTVVFAGPRGKYSGLFELYVQPGSAGTSQADELTAHIPRYIPADIVRMEPAPNLGMLFILSAKERSRLYVYTYRWAGDKRVQQGFGRWSLPVDAETVTVMGDKLVIVGVDGTIGSIDLADGVEEGEAISPRLDLLERFVCEQDPSQGKSFVDLTTWQHPVDGFAVVDAASGVGITQFEVVTQGFNQTLVIDGLYANVYLGARYRMRYEFSPIFMRDQNGLAIQDAQLQLRTFTVKVKDSADFDLTVQPLKRPVRSQRFTVNQTGVSEIDGATVPLATGSMRVPVLSAAETTRIAVESDSHLPCNVQGATWEGIFALRSKRT